MSSYAETSIYYDDEPVFESEDPAIYGTKVASLVIKSGWLSPNYVYGRHWARVQKIRLELDQQVKNHVLQLPADDRERAVLREPASRVMRVSIFQKAGPYPDVDNLLGGLKHTIDALRKVRFKKIKEEGKFKVRRLENGNGLIWDDAPKYLRIAEIFVSHIKGAGHDPTTGSYVVLDIFDWPE